MADKPIPFTGRMVRAILEGRKSQTRRVLKPSRGYQSQWLSPETVHSSPSCYLATVDGELGVQMQHSGSENPMSPLTWVKLPYAPGDRLWVREAWRSEARFDHLPPQDVPRGALVSFEADYSSEPNDGCRGRYRHGRFMPRWASRIKLTVTSVRVERLQDISEADAIAEGLDAWCRDFYEDPSVSADDIGRMAAQCGEPMGSYRCGFACLWNSINGPGAWQQNLWVAAYSFVADHRNIDARDAAP